VFAPAADGGYWAIGLREPDAVVFEGVPMSRDDTGARQRARLDELGLRTVELGPLVDIDDIADARAVAAAAPVSRFAAALAGIESALAAASSRGEAVLPPADPAFGGQAREPAG
jgi:hypothetical protein